MSTNQYTFDQNRAIEFFPFHTTKKHLVIEAGAGSGKTTILKERIKFLLLNRDFLPEDLIVITFTKNSTSELKHRIAQLDGENNLSEKVKFVHVSTIDSFFALLVESLYPIWWDANARLASKIPAQLSLLEDNHALIDLENVLLESMEDFSIQDMSQIADFILAGGLEKVENAPVKRSPLQALLLTMLSDSFLSSDINQIRISAQTIHPATQKILEKCYSIARNAYAKRIEAGLFTYQDRNVFLKENLHYSCPLFFKELIVDEYQDTNHIQHSILWKLVELNQAQMTVVGDPKQSIYAFRGSNVDVFQSLLRDEQWNVISLDVNFRSTQKLLSEVNVLSHLSFDWQTPDLPTAFKESFFYNEAIKKSINHKALKAAVLGTQDINTQPSVDPLRTVTLFEYCAQKDKNKGKLKTSPPTKREFNENNIKSLGHYLIEQKNENIFEWKDVAILCEKNKQIAKIKKIFTQLKIPFLSDISSEKSNETSFTDIIGLSLFNVLNDGIQTKSMDLFYILISPLTEFSFDDVLAYFYYDQIDHQNEKISVIIEILQKYHTQFHDQFFISWQSCRWELANLCAQYTHQKDSLIFCRQLDDFAQRVFSLSQIESTDSIKKILRMPTLPNKQSAQLKDIENAISIKTVHGAKGLEWDFVCFYPTMSKYEPPEPFSVSISWPYLDINWLSEDIKSLSFLEKTPNEKFTEIDNHYDEEKGKKIWFSDLRNSLEKNFERKRIFYTAFTRARKKLIFVHPERQGASSARQLDKKFNFSGYEKNFEQDVFLKYAYLTQENKTDAEHIRFYLEPAHTLTDQESYPFDSQVISAQEEDTILDNHNTIDTDPDPFSLNCADNRIQVDSIQNTEEFSGRWELISTPTSLIQQKQRRRRAVHAGILFHVKSENKLFSNTSVHHLIHSNAIRAWTEFEIWNRKNFDTFNTERKIIDLLALFHKTEFDKIFNHLSNSSAYLKQNIENDSEYVFLIVDFKTGSLTNAGIQQIEHYATLIEKICLSGWFKSITPKCRIPNIVSVLISKKF